MFMNKNGRKMRYPYARLALFGLAATGAASIFNKSKRFIKNKMNSVSDMMKSMKYE